MDKTYYEIKKGSPCIIWYEVNKHPLEYQATHTTKDHIFELWEDHVMNTDKFYIFKKDKDGVTWFIRLDNAYVKKVDDVPELNVSYQPVVPVEYINIPIYIPLQIAKIT